MMKNPALTKTNFITNRIDADIHQHRHEGKVVTRFPPEPNGYLHIGHAKSICLNFGIAARYDSGPCYLRFDDTNPANESEEYIRAIEADINWLGYSVAPEHHRFASDYFETLYQLALYLIRQGKAYVCSLSPDAIRDYRGSLTEAGRESPDRDRPVEENLDLFRRMRNGEFPEGSYSLRARIDMAAGNINMRDPTLYRIKYVHHHRQGDQWCIYPMYDFSHPLSDAIEEVTHSLCTLEFEDHRPLYNWVVQNCDMEHQPEQIEFSRLNLNYTITSKRRLRYLVENQYVDGWDDPRMPTLCALRRRGFPPVAIRNLCEEVGVSKQDSVIDFSLLEESARDALNHQAPRRMAVLQPLKVIIQNYPEISETLNVPNHPQNPSFGRRDIPFSRELWIERDDFMEHPIPGFKRLSRGGRARLMFAYIIECEAVIKDSEGIIQELHCRYLPETLGGKKPHDGQKAKGVIHWVDAPGAGNAEVRLYDRLFNRENPQAEADITDSLNPESLSVLSRAKVEPSLLEATPEESFQFNRLGYFCADQHEHNSGRAVFNRTVTLRQTWQKKI